MRSFVLTGAVALGALVAGPARAPALDMCFDTNFRSIIVAKGYSAPSKGTCRPLMGFEGHASLGGTPSLVSGTACLNSAGNTLRVAYTVYPQIDPTYRTVLVGQIDLPYPSLENGHAVEQDPSVGPGFFWNTASAGPCAFPEPIP